MKPTMRRGICSAGAMLIIGLGAMRGYAQDAGQVELPQHVYLKTKTASLTHEWYVALHEGKLWIKKNPLSRQAKEAEPSPDSLPYNPRLWYHIGDGGRPKILPEEETIHLREHFIVQNPSLNSLPRISSTSTNKNTARGFSFIILKGMLQSPS